MTRKDTIALRLMYLRERAACRLRLHDWRYFVDGFVGRSCTRCHAVQYDLPGVGR